MKKKDTEMLSRQLDTILSWIDIVLNLDRHGMDRQTDAWVYFFFLEGNVYIFHEFRAKNAKKDIKNNYSDNHHK